MNTSKNIALGTATAVASLDELFSVAVVLAGNTSSACQRLAGLMKRCRNGETRQIFIELAEMENTRLVVLREQARKAGARTDIEIGDIWHDHDLRGALAREIADNPYLMTPYHALKLAVINKERMFEIFSALAGNQEDETIRQHAEALSRGVLSEIAQLRLRRRRAARAEIRPLLARMDMDTISGDPPGDPSGVRDELGVLEQNINIVVCFIARSVWQTWLGELSAPVRLALDDLLGECREDTEKDAPDVKVEFDDSDLFSALKSLLREMTAAVDLLLEYAETAKAEGTVKIAQNKAEGFLKKIDAVRFQLDQISGL